MHKFAILVCPLNLNHVKNYWPITRLIPEFVVRSFLGNTSSFKAIPVTCRHNGSEFQGYFIVCPCLPENFSALSEEQMVGKIFSAANIAGSLDVKILGLSGGLSLIADRRPNELLKGIKIPFTTGNTFSAWSLFEALYRTAKAKKISLNEAVITIIDATGAIGSLCARKLAQYSPKLVIAGRDRNKLERLKQTIQQLAHAEVLIEQDAQKAAKGADIIVFSDAASAEKIDIKGFKNNAIVCGMNFSKDTRERLGARQDLVVIEAGFIKLPFPLDSKFDIGMAKDIIPAGVAESLLLFMDGKMENYSLGENINPDKLDEIADIAARYKFQVFAPTAPLL